MIHSLASLAVALGGMNWLGLLFVGAAVIWSVALYGRRTKRRDRVLVSAYCGGWILVWLGLAGPVLAMAGLAGIPLILIAVPLMAVMCVNRYREAERRALVNLIVQSVRRGIPLVPVVTAYGREHWGEVGFRAELLAANLALGMTLPDALSRTGHPLPMDAMLAARLCDGKLDFADLLCDATDRRSTLIWEWNALLAQLLYIILTITVMMMCLIFLLIRVLPTLQQIALDFNMTLGAPLELIVAAANTVARNPSISIPVLLIALMGLLIVTCLLAAYYTGWLSWEPSALRRWTAKYHGALIMQTMAQYVHQDIPVPYAVSQLAERYPAAYVRKRLRHVAWAAAEGGAWIPAMMESQLVGKTEGNVLQSAERAGNLEWALREMADRVSQRSLYRWRIILKAWYPIFVFIAAIPLFFLAAGLFGWLSSIIEILS